VVGLFHLPTGQVWKPVLLLEGHLLTDATGHLYNGLQSGEIHEGGLRKISRAQSWHVGYNPKKPI